MCVVAAALLRQKTRDVNHLGIKALFLKESANSLHAERIPMVTVNVTNNVFRTFMHLKEADGNRLASYPAKFCNGPLHAFNRQMFEQVVKETKIERFVRCFDLENISFVKSRIRKCFRALTTFFSHRSNPL